MAAVDDVRAKVVHAIEARDPNAFELAVRSAFDAGLPRGLAGLFADALLMPWHTRHEDLAQALQRLKDPVAIDSLFEAALSKYDYLNYDEFFGLARKCTWALADIGTVEAKRRLEQLAKCGNGAVEAYAQKRLDRWENEKERKGALSVT